MMARLFPLLFASAAALRAPPVSDYNVEWLSFTPFDRSQYSDGMPLGNGRVVALAWGNTTSGGVDMYIRSPRAQHTDSTLFTIARVSIALSPNPYSSGAYYNQTLHLESASVIILAGGTSVDDYAVSFTVFVDANSDTVAIQAASRDGVTPYSMTASVTSVRAATRTSYSLPFVCNASSTAPDVIIPDPVPAPLPAASIGLYHVNDVSSGDMAFFNDTLVQQGLASLLDTFSDPLDGRIFGLGAIGGAGVDGTGAALTRSSPTILTSAAPATAFAVAVSVVILPDAGADASFFMNALAAAFSETAPFTSRFVASTAWWSAFWGRSYISLPATPTMPRIGVFPCSNASMYQSIALNSSTGALTLADGRCFIRSAGQSSIMAGPCAGTGTDGQWTLTPCTASNCNSSAEFWVISATDGDAMDMPGAACPWIDTYPPDKPAGSMKNQLFAYNATDSTLRCLCANCYGQCVSAAVVPPPSGNQSIIAQIYALTRFVQAVQAGTEVPIKFNGMLFTNQAGENGVADVDYRQWGSDNWWQNTRLPYGNMMAAGDFDSMRSVLDWASSFIPLALARVQTLLPGEQGIYFTETVTNVGLFQQGEYGCSGRPDGYPVWLENSGWVQYDFGGNALGPEAGIMAMDYYLHTLDATAAAKYIPLATHTVDFYMTHYPNRTSDGKLLIWPTQVLETYWCAWPGWTDCCENDLPQLAGLYGLLTRLLALPNTTNLLTPAQRAAYSAFLAILPPLPLSADGSIYAPAAVYPSNTHNSEVPELYGVHYSRMISAGRAAVDSSVNLTTGIATFNAVGLARANTGWYYGIMDAALLGMASQAFSMVLDRAQQPPASGYRFPAFAQHYQDYEPSADHFANHNTALQLMLMQLADDGFGNGDGVSGGTIVLFPAWPCANDVSFKLWGPYNTTVEVVYANGTLVELDVQPSTRLSAVKWANCVTVEQAHAVLEQRTAGTLL